MRSREEIIKYFREEVIPKSWTEEFIRVIENTNPEFGPTDFGVPFEEYIGRHCPSKVFDIVLDAFPKPPCKYTDVANIIHNPTLEKWRVLNQRYLDWLQGYEDTAKWVYRLESTKPDAGLWYDSKGNWCLETKGLGCLPECQTKFLPMGYDERYKKGGRSWFSSCSRLEDLSHWYSYRDAKKLIDEKGFVFTRYLATEYYEYPMETTFIRHTSLVREVLDILDVFPEYRPQEISEQTYWNMRKRCDQQGKHRFRYGGLGAFCTVCGYYGGCGNDYPPLGSGPDLICHGEAGWTAIIKG